MKLLLSILPPLILVLIFYVSFSKRDERLSFALMRALLAGMVIVYPVALLEQKAIPVHMAMDLKGILFSNFIVVGIAEELAKLLLAYYCLKWGSIHLKKPVSIILITVSAAMGFALIENIIYVHDGGYLTAVLRAVSSIPMHASTAVLIGYFGSQEELRGDTTGWIKGFLLGVILHGFYNSYAMYFNNSDWFIGVFVISFFYVVLSKRILSHSKKWQTLYPLHEKHHTLPIKQEV